ncbi:MAG: hypothetical protein KIB40_09245 [Pantoea sp.]|nr:MULTISPECIES: hypothetical protein [Pantoea]MBS6033328.1 hypothetical protein [Pantoea sp.]MDH2124112.1 hypothetical protein [Pantoea brenneri]
MRHHPLPRLPALQQKSGWFQHEVGRVVRLQLQHHLMLYAGQLLYRL